MVTRPIPFRLDEEILARIDRIAQAMTARVAGAHVTRASIVRTALEHGLTAVETELGLARRSPKKRTK